MRLTSGWKSRNKNRWSCQTEDGKVSIVKMPNDKLIKYRVYLSGRKIGNFESLVEALHFISGH